MALVYSGLQWTLTGETVTKDGTRALSTICLERGKGDIKTEKTAGHLRNNTRLIVYFLELIVLFLTNDFSEITLLLVKIALK